MFCFCSILTPPVLLFSRKQKSSLWTLQMLFFVLSTWKLILHEHYDTLGPHFFSCQMCKIIIITWKIQQRREEMNNAKGKFIFPTYFPQTKRVKWKIRMKIVVITLIAIPVVLKGDCSLAITFTGLLLLSALSCHHCCHSHKKFEHYAGASWSLHWLLAWISRNLWAPVGVWMMIYSRITLGLSSCYHITHMHIHI